MNIILTPLLVLLSSCLYYRVHVCGPRGVEPKIILAGANAVRDILHFRVYFHIQREHIFRGP